MSLNTGIELPRDNLTIPFVNVMSLNFLESRTLCKYLLFKVLQNAWTIHTRNIILHEKLLQSNAIFQTMKIFSSIFLLVIVCEHFMYCPLFRMRIFWNKPIHQINVHLFYHQYKRGNSAIYKRQTGYEQQIYFYYQ